MKVLEDEQICGDLLACLSGTKQQHSHDPARRVDAITQAVAAVRQHGHHLVSHQLIHFLGSSIFQLQRVACNRILGAQPTKHCCIWAAAVIILGQKQRWSQVLPSGAKYCRLAQELAQVFVVCLGSK